MATGIFVIRNSDGDTYVEQTTEEKFLKDLAAGEYGGRHCLTAEDAKKKADTNYWGNGMLVIRGEVVIPKPIESITKYTL